MNPSGRGRSPPADVRRPTISNGGKSARCSRPTRRISSIARSRRPRSVCLAVHFRQHDVLEHGAIGQQVKRLKDEADAPAAQSGPLILGQRRRFDTVKKILPAGRPVEATDDVQQRRFPRAGRAGDRQPFAAPQHEVDVDQRVDSGIGPELLAHLTQVEDAVGIGSSRLNRQRWPDVLRRASFDPPLTRPFCSPPRRVGRARAARQGRSPRHSLPSESPGCTVTYSSSPPRSTSTRDVPSAASDTALVGTAVTAPFDVSIGIVRRTENPARLHRACSPP